MWIEIINGPNLHRLGKREPGIYGTVSMDSCLETLHQLYDDRLRLTYFQSNHDRLYESQDAGVDAFVLNAGAYTHTSLALADALGAITPPTIEVHISNVYQREELRQHSLLSSACQGVIVGFGMDGYRLAIESILGGTSPNR